ncbi:MAG: hypothetical protein IKC10_04520 [Alphaproteobacteria bacterium]|nr:hypothetical protein [Alphaproteobacteria bacterium]
MKTKSTDTTKSDNYTKEQIKENCIIEFLCLLSDKPRFSIKMFIENIIKLFKK